MNDWKVRMHRPGNSIAPELNLDKKEDMQEILQLLQIQGYLVLKNVTAVKESCDGAIQDLSNNKVRLILSLKGWVCLLYNFSKVCN